MYRWHLADPIAWQREARITIQQIAWKDGLVETRDDWSTAAFWCEPTPSARLPTLPDLKARTANLPNESVRSSRMTWALRLPSPPGGSSSRALRRDGAR